MPEHLRIVSYNIHQGYGMDLRLSTRRIGEVLQEIDADLIALQEVYHPQAEELAAQLGYEMHMVTTEERSRGRYGNVTLARRPVEQVRRFSLSQPNKEPRAGLWVSVFVGGAKLHFLNVHLGLSQRERAEQARLIKESILPTEAGPKILVGDTNEWREADAAKILQGAFSYAETPKTFPAFLPMIKLDRLYWDVPLQNKSVEVWRSKKAAIASDHAPVVATFSISG